MLLRVGNSGLLCSIRQDQILGVRILFRILLLVWALLDRFLERTENMEIRSYKTLQSDHDICLAAAPLPSVAVKPA